MELIDRKKRETFYSVIISGESKDFTLVDFLDNSSCDEICEIDLNTGTFKQFSSHEGKYFTPLVEANFKSIYDFTLRYVVPEEDKEIFQDLMDPDHILERLEASPLPNFRFATFRYKLQNGEFRWVEQCIMTGENRGLKKGVVRLYVFDIQNRKKRENEHHVDESNIGGQEIDVITGLHSSKSFFKKAQEIVDNSPQIWCLVSVDINKFKLYNEWFGKQGGDLLLARIGMILKEKEAEIHGLAGYFGHDDFAILMPYSMEEINKLHETISQSIIDASQSLGFWPAFGVYVLEKEKDVIDGFERSTIACSKAKNDIKNRIYLFSPEMQTLFAKEVQILSEFMDALKNDEITFFLQPQCRISSKKIVGLEALARWIKPNGEIVSPALFIPLLEKHGFIIDLDKYLWEKIIAWVKDCLNRHIHVVPVSINISRVDIFSIDVVDFFDKLTKKYQIPPSLIKLEITESAYAETAEAVTELVANLRKKGFMVLMDDFGSGYSSLNMLSSLKVDAIKLDALFLKVDEENKEAYEKGIHILESVINMAKIISIPIIVEGVETKSQCDFLENLGCRYIQGFYFYKGMPKEEVEKLLSDENNVDERGFVVKTNDQFRIREFLDKNIFSDNMLNNIIGAVAYYSVHDNDVDIVRFNEQFYKLVNVPDFAERLLKIQNYVPDVDKEKLYNMFKRAEEDKLNGAWDDIRFYTSDGTILSIHMHLYFLGIKEGAKRFYGASRNATELNEAKQQLALISEYSSDTIIFLRKFSEKWSFHVAAYHLAEDLQESQEDVENTLNQGKIYKYFANRSYFNNMRKNIDDMIANNETFSLSLDLLNSYREIVPVTVRFTPVSSKANNIKYVIQIKQR